MQDFNEMLELDFGLELQVSQKAQQALVLSRNARVHKFFSPNPEA